MSDKPMGGIVVLSDRLFIKLIQAESRKRLASQYTEGDENPYSETFIRELKPSETPFAATPSKKRKGEIEEGDIETTGDAKMMTKKLYDAIKKKHGEKEAISAFQGLAPIMSYDAACSQNGASDSMQNMPKLPGYSGRFKNAFQPAGNKTSPKRKLGEVEEEPNADADATPPKEKKKSGAVKHVRFTLPEDESPKPSNLPKTPAVHKEAGTEAPGLFSAIQPTPRSGSEDSSSKHQSIDSSAPLEPSTSPKPIFEFKTSTPTATPFSSVFPPSSSQEDANAKSFTPEQPATPNFAESFAGFSKPFESTNAKSFLFQGFNQPSVPEASTQQMQEAVTTPFTFGQPSQSEQSIQSPFLFGASSTQPKSTFFQFGAAQNTPAAGENRPTNTFTFQPTDKPLFASFSFLPASQNANDQQQQVMVATQDAGDDVVMMDTDMPLSESESMDIEDQDMEPSSTFQPQASHTTPHSSASGQRQEQPQPFAFSQLNQQMSQPSIFGQRQEQPQPNQQPSQPQTFSFGQQLQPQVFTFEKQNAQAQTPFTFGVSQQQFHQQQLQRQQLQQEQQQKLQEQQDEQKKQEQEEWLWQQDNYQEHQQQLQEQQDEQKEQEWLQQKEKQEWLRNQQRIQQPRSFDFEQGQRDFDAFSSTSNIYTSSQKQKQPLQQESWSPAEKPPTLYPSPFAPSYIPGFGLQQQQGLPIRPPENPQNLDPDNPDNPENQSDSEYLADITNRRFAIPRSRRGRGGYY